MSAARLVGTVNTPDGVYVVKLGDDRNPILIVDGGKPRRMKPAEADGLASLLRQAVSESERYGGARR